MEPPQKKHRTSTFTYPPALNQMNPPIHAMRPPLQGMKPVLQPPQQMMQNGNPALHPRNQMIGHSPQIQQYTAQNMGPPVDAWKSKASAAAAQLNQKLLGTGTRSPQGGSVSWPTADGSVLYTRDIFTVPSDRVGLLIGKGGAKIREIQERSGARMDIAKHSEAAAPHLREVRLSGGKEQTAAARAIIDKLVNNSSGVGFKSNSHHASVNPSKTIQIPSTTVGLVIGRGGDNIRKIIQETSCTIHIEKDAEAIEAGRTPPQPGYQNVYLKGTDAAVEMAEKAVMELVNGDRVRRSLGLPAPYRQQFGQFLIPQYQQYGAQIGAQQIYGLQQPYIIPGQQLIQPTYAVMPGYATTQQYPPPTYMSAPNYNPGTVGVSPQYVGYPFAQYQAAAVQMGFMQQAQTGAAPTQYVSASAQPQFYQVQSLGSPPLSPPPQVGDIKQLANPPQPNQSQQFVQSGVYSSGGGGGPSSPPNPSNITQIITTQRLVKTEQLSQLAVVQDLPGGGKGKVNIQANPVSGVSNGVAISVQSSSLPYGGIPTNAQQQYGGTQKYTAAGQNIITGRSS